MPSTKLSGPAPPVILAIVAVSSAAPSTGAWMATGCARLRQNPMLLCASCVSAPGGVLASIGNLRTL